MLLNTKYQISLLFLAIFCSCGHASSDFDECFKAAGARFSLHPSLLKAIALTESSLNPQAQSKPNANGTVDIGLMQINSSWLPKIGQYGIKKEHLFDPCLNIHVGAWILAHNVSSHGATWRSVGYYNSRSLQHQINYVKSVKNNLHTLNTKPIQNNQKFQSVVIESTEQ